MANHLTEGLRGACHPRLAKLGGSQLICNVRYLHRTRSVHTITIYPPRRSSHVIICRGSGISAWLKGPMIIKIDLNHGNCPLHVLHCISGSDNRKSDSDDSYMERSDRSGLPVGHSGEHGNLGRCFPSPNQARCKLAIRVKKDEILLTYLVPQVCQTSNTTF